MSADWTNEIWLRAVCSPATYARGERYAARGRVLAWQATEQEVTATVQGATNYQTHLWLRRGVIEYACTCAFAAEGAFCKHLAAVCLMVRLGDAARHPPLSQL